MKNLKAIILLCLTILSGLASASEWTYSEVNQEGHYVKLSYTKKWVTPTYGVHGGMMTGELYVDVYSLRPAKVEKIEILDTYDTIEKDFIETKPTHHWLKLHRENSYAGTLSIGKSYGIKVHVDGRVLEFNVKIK